MADIAVPSWDELPAPIDDGAARHLEGARLPRLSLAATNGRLIDLSTEPGFAAIFGYPRTGRPGEQMPKGWDLIPGARGCTPQACAFRDLARDFYELNCRVYGLSVQSTEYQREMAERLSLPFPILSDAELRFSDALRLPTFEVAGMRLVKRLSMIVENGRILKVFYPVSPPDRNANDMLAWLRISGHARSRSR